MVAAVLGELAGLDLSRGTWHRPMLISASLSIWTFSCLLPVEANADLPTATFSSTLRFLFGFGGGGSGAMNQPQTFLVLLVVRLVRFRFVLLPACRPVPRIGWSWRGMAGIWANVFLLASIGRITDPTSPEGYAIPVVRARWTLSGFALGRTRRDSA